MVSPFANISWRAVRVWQRNFDVYKATWRINFIPPVLEPLMYLFAFGVGLGGLVNGISYAGTQVTYLKFIAPGLVASAVMNHAFFETTYASYVRMYYQKTFDAILSTPLMLEDVIVGEILWGATKAFFAGVIMLLITVLWGLIGWQQALLILPVIVVAGLAFAAMGMCFTSLVHNIEMFNLPIFLFITPMFLFSGVFFPLSSLPGWAHSVAMVLPLTFLVSTLRSIAFGCFAPVHGAAVGCLLLIAFCGSFLGIIGMRKRLLK